MNPRRLRNPRQHNLYVALAGPATNFVLAGIAAVVFRVFYADELADLRSGAVQQESWGIRIVFFFGLLNVVLALFNLLPIPPLDGSALVERVLPVKWWPTWLKIRQYSFGILILVVLLVRNIGDYIFGPALDCGGSSSCEPGCSGAAPPAGASHQLPSSPGSLAVARSRAHWRRMRQWPARPPRSPLLRLVAPRWPEARRRRVGAGAAHRR